MSWRRLAPHIYSAAKATATGATITLGSTVFSCYLAIEIEAVSHRTLFAFFPHWYANVEHAHGIDPDLLASARLEAKNQQYSQQQLLLTMPEEKNEETNEEDRTKTVFTIESLLEPARKRVQQVQDMSFVNDLGACAMTS